MSNCILIVHNYYQYAGGEDSVVAAEQALLGSKNQDVRLLSISNDSLKGFGAKIKSVHGTVYSHCAGQWIKRELTKKKPDLTHFHNTFPLISPAAYYAAKTAGVPVVQTLHNYRLLCPNALFYRDKGVCEDCLGKTPPWPGVLRGCYRGSRAATAVVAAMLTVHRFLRTWTRMVDVYIALTEFSRRKFFEGGLPADKIVVKPNFVHPDPGPGDHHGGYALFVGRLAPEKGLETLLKAWEKLGGRIPLKIAGDGPLASLVAEAAERLPGVQWLGRRSKDEVLRLMKDATVLLFPSVSYEGFPMTIAEAYATGLPALSSRLGAMVEIVCDGRTGLHFRPGDPEDLAAKVEWAWTHPRQMAEMEQEARREYEAKYTAERNYEMLMDIYQLAVRRHRGERV
ncbi:MAG: glycosyltransferase family 4 protein [Bacillota bacterium]